MLKADSGPLLNVKEKHIMSDTSFLVIGGGGIGERHLRCIQKVGISRVGLVEPRAERRAELQAKYGVKDAWAEPEQVDFSKFTHAVVATPPSQHFAHTKLLSSRGIHVLCEKPLCASNEEAVEFVKMAASAKGTIRIAYTFRSIEIFRRAKAKVDDGAIGAVKAMHLMIGQYFPTFRPDYMKIYWADPKQGGCSLDAMTHVVDLAFWNMGDLEWLGGLASNLGLKEAPVDDTASVLMRSRDGGHVSIVVNQFQAPNESMLLWVGEKGSLKVEGALGKISVFPRGETEWKSETVAGERDDGYVNQVKLFLEEVEGKKRGLCTASEAAKVLEICLRLKGTFQR